MKCDYCGKYVDDNDCVFVKSPMLETDGNGNYWYANGEWPSQTIICHECQDKLWGSSTQQTGDYGYVNNVTHPVPLPSLYHIVFRFL